MASPTFIFDFDSTLVAFETLELLAELALPTGAEGEAVRAEIARLTDAAMAGEVAFQDALKRRLELLDLRREHVQAAADRAAAALRGTGDGDDFHQAR